MRLSMPCMLSTNARFEPAQNRTLSVDRSVVLQELQRHPAWTPTQRRKLHDNVCVSIKELQDWFLLLRLRFRRRRQCQSR